MYRIKSLYGNKLRVEAISGAAGDEIAMLEERAKELGKSTQYSAIQTAEAMENLASAGFEAGEIYAAMPGLLDLAASDNIELASAAEIAATSLRGFGLAATETNVAHIADVLAESAARTNASVESLGYSFSYVAPMATATGLSMEQTAAAIGILSDAGIKGTKAGTTLRSALTRMVKPTEAAEEAMEALGLQFYNTDGTMKSLADITSMLQTQLGGLSEEQRNNALATIFGQQALTGMLALMEAGPDKINELTESYKSCDGAAKEMADTMNDNTKGSWIELKSALEGAAIAIGEVLIPHIKKAVEWVTEIVTAFGNLDPELQENIVKWGLIVAAIGPVLSIGGKFIGMIGTMVSALSGLGGIFATLAGPVGWIALLGTAIAGLAIAWNKTQDELTKSTGGFIEAERNLESFEGKVRTTDNWLTKLFGEEIKIEFTTDIEEEKEAVKKHYDFMLQDAEDFYKKKWDIDHDGCEDMNEHYKHMEQYEQEYRNRMAHRMKLQTDVDKQKNQSMDDMGKYLTEDMGLDSLEAGNFQGQYATWIEEHAKKVKEGEERINSIYEEAITTRGKLNQEEQDRIDKITEEISSSRTILFSTAADQYNAFKAYHVKEGIIYDEKGIRISKYQKDFNKAMIDSRDTLVKSYTDQIEKIKEHDKAFGTNSENTIRMYEQQAQAVIDFTTEYTNRTNDNIAKGMEFEDATNEAFASIMYDLQLGKINVEQYGITTDRFLELAMDSMINAGASADELAVAIMNIPKEKRADVIAYVNGKTDAEELKRAIDRLENKTIKVTTKYQNVYENATASNAYNRNQGMVSMRKATGTDYALPGLTEVAEYGSEIIATRNSAVLATGRQLINLTGGEKIYNARQTKDILDNMGKSFQIDYSDSLRIINSNIILLKEAIERKNFNNVVNNNIEKIDINEVANIEEIEYHLTEMMERRTYGGV